MAYEEHVALVELAGPRGHLHDDALADEAPCGRDELLAEQRLGLLAERRRALQRQQALEVLLRAQYEQPSEVNAVNTAQCTMSNTAHQTQAQRAVAHHLLDGGVRVLRGRRHFVQSGYARRQATCERCNQAHIYSYSYSVFALELECNPITIAPSQAAYHSTHYRTTLHIGHINAAQAHRHSAQARTLCVFAVGLILRQTLQVCCGHAHERRGGTERNGQRQVGQEQATMQSRAKCSVRSVQ